MKTRKERWKQREKRTKTDAKEEIGGGQIALEAIATSDLGCALHAASYPRDPQHQRLEQWDSNELSDTNV